VGRFTKREHKYAMHMRTFILKLNLTLTLNLATILFEFSMFTLAVYALIFGLKNFKLLGLLKIILIIPFAEILVDVKEIVLFLIQFKIIHLSEATINQIQSPKINPFEIYSIVEFATLILFYTKVLSNNNLIKYFKIILALISVCLIPLLIYKNSNSNLTPYSYSICSFFLIIASIIFFSEKLLDENYLFAERDPVFILASAIFFFFSITFPSYLILQFLNNKESFIGSVISVNNFIFYNFFYLRIIKAFKCQIELKK